MTVQLNHGDRCNPPRQPEGNGPSVLAWATLISGIASWVVIPVAGAMIALICGLIERRKIAEGTSAPEGENMVTVGLICAGIQLALIALAMMAVILFGIFFLSGGVVG